MLIVETSDHATIYDRLSRDMRVVFVPTMGNLHEGHRALIRQARSLGELVVVSIFVNPTQFGIGEDFERYPRTQAVDLALCRAENVDVVWLPSVEMMYPEGLDSVGQFTIQPPGELTSDWCGASRPGHFAGVGLVLAKLFNQIRPEVAVFGQKDAQQLAIMRRLVRDLAFSIEIVAAPTVREADGLAISSRNQYLATPDERRAARALFEVLTTMRRLYQTFLQTRPGQPLPVDWAYGQALSLCKSRWPVSVPIQWEYQGAVDEPTFTALECLTESARLLVAARIGDGPAAVRLIDNMSLVD